MTRRWRYFHRNALALQVLVFRQTVLTLRGQPVFRRNAGVVRVVVGAVIAVGVGVVVVIMGGNDGMFGGPFTWQHFCIVPVATSVRSE